MADFADVLRKNLAKFDDAPPELRSRLYEKARANLQAKIDALPQRPPQPVIDRQFEKLESAISEVEADYAVASEPEFEPDIPIVPDEPVEEPLVPVADPDDAILPADADEALPTASQPTSFGDSEPSIDTVSEPDQGHEAVTVPDGDALSDPAAEVREPNFDAPESTDETADLDDFGDAALADSQADTGSTTGDTDGQADSEDDPLFAFLESQERELETEPGRESPVVDNSDASGVPGDVAAGFAAGGSEPPRPAEREEEFVAERSGAAEPRSSGRGVNMGVAAFVVVVLLLVGALAAGAYLYRDTLMAFVGGGATSEDGLPVRTVPSTSVPVNETAESEAGEASEAAEQPVAQATEGESVEKFTQRLTPDGVEIDEGPSEGAGQTGEGSSVFAQSDEGAAPAAEAPAAENADNGDAPLPIGQRALFYEERTGTQEGTALNGATVWSVVQQEPADGMDPEPAIRAEARIPNLDLVMEMTIKRNGDRTFPASHLIELFFRVPETFSGRGIADVQRVTLKEAESDPGNALIAVPAPLDTNIFVVALTDADTAVQANTRLLRDLGWIDIPMQYVNGRRALITLEKGNPGQAIFDEVFSAWESAPLPDG